MTQAKVDLPFGIAKAAVFIGAMGLAATAAALVWRTGLVHAGAGFLVVFATMMAGLTLYFTAGCAVLRALWGDYLGRLRLAERGHAGETAIIALACDLAAHGAVLMIYGPAPANLALLAVSAVFFVYPVHFLVTTLWTLQPEVRAALTGALRLSTPYFANVPRRVRDRSEYLPVTVSVAVHTESNEVVFATILGALRAIAVFRHATGRAANLVVSDDGLAKLLGAPLSAAALAGADGRARERIDFYRRHQIALVARPLAGRRGKFKKAGNLNYSYAVARRLAQGADPAVLFGPDGPCHGGWAEGEICFHDVICLLDKDSGLAPGVLAATVPEFSADPTLAFTQHVTRASNPGENYFTWLQARFTDTIYRIALPGKALQGLQVHLMGHSAFLRRSFLEATGDWPEDRVSEDYAKALEAYEAGWHGKFIAFPGLDFTEQVCACFGEEADKQQRYCYGMSEVTLERRPLLPLAMRADLLIHYLSYTNLAAALPLVLILLVTHQIYYLFAGMVVNALIFLVLPVVQGCALKTVTRLRSTAEAARFFALNGLAFVGYSYTMASGHWIYFTDAYRGAYEPFKATSVDRLEHSFAAGLALLKAYARKNAPAVVASAAVMLGCALVMADQPPHLIRPLVSIFVAGHALAPLVLTPQLFAGAGGALRAPLWRDSRRRPGVK
ncbi:MAG: hypothetical protein LBG60_03015 [Bifidobacteriaceae bacterium]|jgi:hypothetical protein|nr:hypothetical protein [Bifidobacteriaceae bacterium]